MCSESQNSVQSHLWRIRVAFSKGKHKKVGKLASCNEELEEILGWSERRVLRASKRTSPGLIKTLEKASKQATVVYTALEHHWKCNGGCQSESHDAYLNLGGVAISVGLDVMFALGGGATGPCQILQKVVIVPGDAKPADAKPAASANDIGHVHPSSLLARAQQGYIQLNTAAMNKSLRTTLPVSPPSASPQSIRSLLKEKLRTKAQLPISLEKSVKFDVPTGSVTPVASPDTTPSCTPGPSAQSASPQLIEDLCLFLANGQVKSGTFEVGMNGYFRLNKQGPGLHGVAADKLALVTLPELVEAQSFGLAIISRQTQYELAANITSALLHHPFPWLSTRWTKSDFLFLVDTDSQALRSTHPLFSLHPPSLSAAGSNQSMDNALDDAFGQLPSIEEYTRASLFKLGVILLELIFGHSIEDCHFWKEYCGHDNKPNKQTEICTARRWAKKVLAESGPVVADVIWRCLDCTFGPRPSFTDVAFRESVYENAVKPLMDCPKMNWWSSPQREWRN